MRTRTGFGIDRQWIRKCMLCPVSRRKVSLWQRNGHTRLSRARERKSEGGGGGGGSAPRGERRRWRPDHRALRKTGYFILFVFTFGQFVHVHACALCEKEITYGRVKSGVQKVNRDYIIILFMLFICWSPKIRDDSDTHDSSNPKLRADCASRKYIWFWFTTIIRGLYEMFIRWL